MFELIKKYKREFVYGSYLFLVLELIVTRQFTVNVWAYLATVGVGMGLLVSWILSTYNLFGKKKVSKYSEVVMKIKLPERIFQHVVLPIAIYFSLSIFLFLNENRYMNQAMIMASVIVFFYLMLNIRTSHEKVYSISRSTRMVYDFAAIILFYLTISVVARYGLGLLIGAFIAFGLSLVSLLSALIAHRKLFGETIMFAFICSFIIGITSIYVWKVNIYVGPAILSVVFYLFVSLWNVRFSGSRKFEDYIPPLMYSLMAIILVISL